MRLATRDAGCVVLAALALAATASAHHSKGMFVDTPVWITGVITRYRPVDPHAMIELHEPQAGGPARKWIIEGPRRGRLEQILANNGNVRDDQLLKVGDRISVCGFALRRDWNPDSMYAGWKPEQGRFLHGQLFVMPSGRMQSWGPYGALDTCVRQGDSARDWIEFLDRDPLAHRQWCEALRRTSAPHAAPRALREEVARGLARACR